MKKKNLLLLACALLILSVLAVNAYYYYKDSSEIKSNETNVTKAKNDITREVGGGLQGEGYSISYLSDRDIFLITVTGEPYIVNANEALTRLASFNVRLCSINYLVAPGKGVEGEEIRRDKSCK